MTDQLKIVRIHAQNVPHLHRRKRLDDESKRVWHQESDSVVFSMRWGVVLLKHK